MSEATGLQQVPRDRDVPRPGELRRGIFHCWQQRETHILYTRAITEAVRVYQPLPSRAFTIPLCLRGNDGPGTTRLVAAKWGILREGQWWLVGERHGSEERGVNGQLRGTGLKISRQSETCHGVATLPGHPTASNIKSRKKKKNQAGLQWEH